MSFQQIKGTHLQRGDCVIEDQRRRSSGDSGNSGGVAGGCRGDSECCVWGGRCRVLSEGADG